MHAIDDPWDCLVVVLIVACNRVLVIYTLFRKSDIFPDNAAMILFYDIYFVYSAPSTRLHPVDDLCWDFICDVLRF